MKTRFAIPLALAALAAAPAAAGAAAVPEGAKWTEATIPSTDGVQLHADVLRPKHLGPNDKTPVILSVGPYFNHSGQLGAAGPAGQAPYGPTDDPGPSDRFNDLIEGAKLMERGYTVVLVDLRGFGGSTGCLDWGGPGEQADVVKSVEWAATQPWSTGKVGMYGKSYDGVTGLVGVNKQPKGLEAVVSQEPVYDLYRYLYGDGIRRVNSLLTPALYNLIDATPGSVKDAPTYNVNGANDTQRPGCKVLNWTDQAGNDDHYSAYWRARNLIPGAKGSKVPLFLMQGLTENNTVADGMAQYMRNHKGYQRAWLGPWLHVRGNEKNASDEFITGRSDYFAQVMRFYDRFLKGAEVEDDPMIEIQTNDGVWRAEDVWPPKDAVDLTTELRTGTYVDNGNSSATGNTANAISGIWTVSPPLEHDAHLTGSGRAVIDVSTSVPNANLVVDVYDLNEDNRGPLITRQGHLVRRNGEYRLDLWSTDWKIEKGHRIAVRITDANSDWWLHAGTRQPVTVHEASVTLPFLKTKRTKTIAGDRSTQLDAYLARTVTLPASTVANSESKGFEVPPAMQRNRARAARRAR